MVMDVERLINDSVTGKTKSLETVKYDYSDYYPNLIDLDPKSKEHAAILGKIMKMVTASHREMKKRFPVWDRLDEMLTAYIPLDKGEEEVVDLDKRKPVSIVVPSSYAILETILTYMVAAFLDSPIFKYGGLGPEASDKIGAILLEKVVSSHCDRNKVGLALHTFFRDSLIYGFGVVAATWHKEYGKRIIQNSAPNDLMMQALGGAGAQERETGGFELLYEGNALINIDPRTYLPDPSVPIHRVQDGEYVGWIHRDNRVNLLDKERHEEDGLFNIKYLKHIDARSTLMLGVEQDRRRGGDAVARYSNSTYGMGSSATDKGVDTISIYINLVPSEWGIGDSDYPEKWFFRVAGDSVIVTAKSANLNHNRYPVVVAAPDYDGYSTTPTSRLEISFGLQTVMNWLFNSHIANVRKCINDMVVVDPSAIMMDDIENPEAGKIIRLRPRAWGRDVKSVISQLNIQDITRGNIADSAMVFDMMQRGTAAVDALQGVIRKGSERRTATEARDTRSAALSRLQTAAKVIGMQAMWDLAYLFASHSQQLMSTEVYVRLTGRLEDVLRDEYGMTEETRKVAWSDINVDYDIVPKYGSEMRGDADLWIRLLQVLTQQPDVRAQFDMIRIFKHIARISGADDVGEFIQKNPVTAQVLPDQQVGNMAASGQIAPVGQVGAPLG